MAAFSLTTSISAWAGKRLAADSAADASRDLVNRCIAKRSLIARMRISGRRERPRAGRLVRQMDGWLTGLAVVESHDYGVIGEYEGIAALLRRNFEPALDRGDGHRSVRQLFGDRCGVDRAGVRHADGDIDEHVVGGLAHHPEKSDAGVADRVRNRA